MQIYFLFLLQTIDYQYNYFYIFNICFDYLGVGQRRKFMRRTQSELAEEAKKYGIVDHIIKPKNK